MTGARHQQIRAARIGHAPQNINGDRPAGELRVQLAGKGLLVAPLAGELR